MDEIRSKIFKLLDVSILLSDRNKSFIWSVTSNSENEYFLESILGKLQTENKHIISSLKESLKDIDDNLSIYELKDIITDSFISGFKIQELRERIDTDIELNNLLTQLV